MLVQSFEQNGIRIEMLKSFNGQYIINKFVKDKKIDLLKQGTGFNFEDAADVFQLLVQSAKEMPKRKKVLGLF